MAELGITADEAGAMDMPFVIEMFDYWEEFPPVHLLVRALAGYQGKPSADSRSERAQQMGDFGYRAPQQSDAKPTENPQFSTGARHLDAAPGHIQEAIARVKRGEHLNLPKSEAA